MIRCSERRRPFRWGAVREHRGPRPGDAEQGSPGTGTGYNTALLCHRLGADQVTSVEYDDHLAGHAGRVLHDLGHRPTVVTGDGADGHPDGAPYDRLIATYAVTAIPGAWLRQVRPGGTIVAGVHRDLGVGITVRLVVDDDGGAHGHLLPDNAYFMPTRRHTAADVDRLLRAAAAHPPTVPRPSALPGPVADDAAAWAVLAGLLMPDVIRSDLTRDDGNVQWLLAPDGSWAYYRAADSLVEQAGPRDLWTRLETVHEQWRQAGEPGRTDLGLSVTADGAHRAWIHRRDDVVGYD